jgi:hypothetical protein
MFASSLVRVLQEVGEEISGGGPHVNGVVGTFLYFVFAMSVVIFIVAWMKSTGTKD